MKFTCMIAYTRKGRAEAHPFTDADAMILYAVLWMTDEERTTATYYDIMMSGELNDEDDDYYKTMVMDELAGA